MNAIRLTNTFLGARITQYYGENPSDYKQYGLAGHEGIDFVLPGDGLIYAPMSGLISIDEDTPRGNYGRYVCIHDDIMGAQLWLCHMEWNRVSYKERVMPGTLIGKMGSTGHSTGPHVHLMLCRTLHGVRQNIQNGYKGMIDPLGLDIIWLPHKPS